METLLNGDAALAGRVGIGLHLRSAQLHQAGIGEAIAPLKAAGRSIGASCHDVQDLLQAERLGCDFAVLGPLLQTRTHPGAAGIGWDAFAAMRERVSLPVHAIGGLGSDDIGIARAHGAQGIAAIRGLWDAGGAAE